MNNILFSLQMEILFLRLCGSFVESLVNHSLSATLPGSCMTEESVIDRNEILSSSCRAYAIYLLEKFEYPFFWDYFYGFEDDEMSSHSMSFTDTDCPCCQ